MSLQAQTPIDSPSAWVKDHIDRYVATDGADGHDWNGTTTLLLTVKGRRSGNALRTALIYGRDGDNYIIVASKGGAPDHPSWYLNLTANPEVELQVKDQRFKAIARTATAEERPKLWAIMEKEWPAYNEYQEKTEREIPVVVLEPVR